MNAKPIIQGDGAHSRKQEPSTQARPPVDLILLIFAITLVGIGLVTVFDASYASQLRLNHTAYFLFNKQVRWALFGLLGFFVALRVPYWTWRRHAFTGICIAIVLLMLVFVPHIGLNLNGAHRWIGFMQPSEFAKLAIIIYLTQFAATIGKRIVNFQAGLVWPMGIVAAICALVAKEPDLGTAMVIFGVAIVMMFVAGARRTHLVGILSLAIVGVALFSLMGYRAQRLNEYLHPETSYQVWHSLIAIGTGGIPGVGLGESIEKIFIPMASTDSIFPVIAEEFGLIGSIVLIIIYLVVVARGCAIAHNTRDPFGSFLAVGLTSLIALHSIINIGVATAIIPDTGIPLPFISYGGSALVLMMTSVGLLLNVSRFPDGDGRLDERRVSESQFEDRWSKRSYLPSGPPQTHLRGEREADQPRRAKAIHKSSGMLFGLRSRKRQEPSPYPAAQRTPQSRRDDPPILTPEFNPGSRASGRENKNDGQRSVTSGLGVRSGPSVGADRERLGVRRRDR